MAMKDENNHPSQLDNTCVPVYLNTDQDPIHLHELDQTRIQIVDDHKLGRDSDGTFQVGKPRIPTWSQVEIGKEHDEAYLMMDDTNVDAKELQTKYMIQDCEQKEKKQLLVTK